MSDEWTKDALELIKQRLKEYGARIAALEAHQHQYTLGGNIAGPVYPELPEALPNSTSSVNDKATDAILPTNNTQEEDTA